LEPITDPVAQQLETGVGSSTVVDVMGMRPDTARALDLFQSKVAAVGGSIVLKSAYRPASYQSHLENVWYKWMEIRNNHDAACQDLRAQVQEEFTRHHLIESQHPVAMSDHTRGLAFDATVELPSHARLGRRRITLDALAHLAGLTRPAIAADPVHFKYVGGMSYHLLRLRRRHNA
jgi:D-alanyl-D-alanine dipeptidase